VLQRDMTIVHRESIQPWSDWLDQFDVAEDIVRPLEDGTRALAGAFNLMLVDLAGRGRKRILRGHVDSVTSIAMAPNGVLAASSSFDRTVKVWDLVRCADVGTLRGHKDSVTDVMITPDCRYAVTASLDQTVAVWVLQSEQLLATFGADSGVKRVAIAPDGQTIVAGDEDGRVHFLRLENAENQAFRSESICL
jgi:WD40 repeat protein